MGICSGPVIGGLFVEHTTWRWIFYVMFPFCFIGFATIPWVLTLKPRTETLRQKLLRVDWLGGFLFITSCTIFLVAISWGGTQEPWGSFRTIVPLVLGILGLAVTALWETYGAREPFLRRSLFHCPSSFAAYVGATIQGFLVRLLSFHLSLFPSPDYFTLNTANLCALGSSMWHSTTAHYISSQSSSHPRRRLVLTCSQPPPRWSQPL